MIFQSLIALYDRLAQTNDVPPYGFSLEDIGFVVNIDRSGNMIGQPEDLRTKIKSNVYTFKQSTVPYSNKVNVRSIAAATTPNFMVDKADFIFGMSGNSNKEVSRQSFIELINKVCAECNDEGVVAVKAFFDQWDPLESVMLRDWKEICGIHGKWVAFRLEGDTCFVHERSEVYATWIRYVKKEKFAFGINLIDGKKSEIQHQYTQYKFGSGASLVSFNEKSYESYCKKKGENAPISVEAEFKSATALKYLLRSKMQRIHIGDATTVFWTENKSPVEMFMGQILNPSDQDAESVIEVNKFLESFRKGKLPVEIKEDAGLKFYILGLSQNKARLALRFWYVCTVDELMTRIKAHFDCLDMEHSEKDVPFPGIWHLLKETARESKDISPVLSGALTRSVLTGENYPLSLYHGVLGRIRADQKVNYLRIASLKAVLQRNYKKEVPVALDTDRREVAYLLGRLFAVLEKAQLDALGKVNSTIKDRFFSAASATPASVFPRLMSLAQHHIDKAEYGRISDRRIAEIMEHVSDFPSHMGLKEQGLFAIAYYQQKNEIYRKLEKKEGVEA